jgi:hypothetical protein
MPDKQEMRAKARELLDNSRRGDRIRKDNRLYGGRTSDGGDFIGGRKTAAPEDSRNIRSMLEPEVVREAYELDAARTPRTKEWKKERGRLGTTSNPRQVGPMTEDTRRQTRRGVRGEASRFADGGCVRGDGIAMKGKTKGRVV